jgi:carotenoid 1,2-hydratase
MELTLPSVLSITSSVRDDVWHAEKSPRAFEWWYFDAISDDGRDAVIIIFLDNFIFSPRHADPSLGDGDHMLKIRNFEPKERYPAVSFTYIRDGQVLYRALNEYSETDLETATDHPGCVIGESRFRFDTAQYGSGYMVSATMPLGDGKRVSAELEWLSVETDFAPEISGYKEFGIGWNAAAPRADVSGKIEVAEESGESTDAFHFRGTGLHDHVVDDRWLPETETRFHRGGAHFADCTALFGHFEEPGDEISESQIVLVRDGAMCVLNAWCEEQEPIRDRHGNRHPSNLIFTSPEGVCLSVRCTHVLDSGFFYLRMWNEVSLTLEDGSTRTSEGLSELVVPHFQRHRWLDWLANIRRASKDF